MSANNNCLQPVCLPVKILPQTPPCCRLSANDNHPLGEKRYKRCGSRKGVGVEKRLGRKTNPIGMIKTFSQKTVYIPTIIIPPPHIAMIITFPQKIVYIATTVIFWLTRGSDNTFASEDNSYSDNHNPPANTRE